MLQDLKKDLQGLVNDVREIEAALGAFTKVRFQYCRAIIAVKQLPLQHGLDKQMVVMRQMSNRIALRAHMSDTLHDCRYIAQLHVSNVRCTEYTVPIHYVNVYVVDSSFLQVQIQVFGQM